MDNYNKQRRLKIFISILSVIILAIVGISLIPSNSSSSKSNDYKYVRDAGRKTIDIANTEFAKSLKNGDFLINKYLGGKWIPFVMPIDKKYEDILKEKLVFSRVDESPTNFTELVVIDTYDEKTFPNISNFLKKHAEELQKKNPNGKIKILMDNSKGIVYQWIIKGIDNQVNYLEFGRVEKTNEGILNIKYINKGTTNLEEQRRNMIKVFSKI